VLSGSICNELAKGSHAWSSLSPFYAGWDVYQQHLVAAIALLTSEQLALRSSPDNWSVGMLVTHIVSAHAWWSHTRMGEGSADLAPLGFWDQNEEEPLRPAAELVTGLERTWQMIPDALAHLTPADLEQVFPHPDGGERPARSRQSRETMLWTPHLSQADDGSL
jgi:uncharacterized damage-inducible protein DinB